MNQLQASLRLAKDHLKTLKESYLVRTNRKIKSAKGHEATVLYEPEKRRIMDAIKETEQRISDLQEAMRIKRRG